jgi:hypothetical protein
MHTTRPEHPSINPITIPTKSLHFPSRLLHLTTLRNNNLLHRPLIARAHILHFTHDVQSFDHFAEDDVFAVEVRGRSGQDEELAAVGVGAGVLLRR